MGAVAQAGDPAAETAALDSRVAPMLPFNFGETLAGPAKVAYQKGSPAARAVTSKANGVGSADGCLNHL
jgi:hypothetical protein